jgi:hypothetical protein
MKTWRFAEEKREQRLAGYDTRPWIFSEQREAVKPIERSEKGLTKGVGSGRTRSPFRLRVHSQRRHRGDAGVASSTFGFYGTYISSSFSGDMEQRATMCSTGAVSRQTFSSRRGLGMPPTVYGHGWCTLNTRLPTSGPDSISSHVVSRQPGYGGCFNAPITDFEWGELG